MIPEAATAKKILDHTESVEANKLSASDSSFSLIAPASAPSISLASSAISSPIDPSARASSNASESLEASISPYASDSDDLESSSSSSAPALENPSGSPVALTGSPGNERPGENSSAPPDLFDSTGEFPAIKKAKKNTREKRRRSELNTKFEQLREILSIAPGRSKVEKVAILGEAIKEISKIQKVNEEFRKKERINEGLGRSSSDSLNVPMATSSAAVAAFSNSLSALSDTALRAQAQAMARATIQAQNNEAAQQYAVQRMLDHHLHSHSHLLNIPPDVAASFSHLLQSPMTNSLINSQIQPQKFFPQTGLIASHNSSVASAAPSFAFPGQALHMAGPQLSQLNTNFPQWPGNSTSALVLQNAAVHQLAMANRISLPNVFSSLGAPVAAQPTAANFNGQQKYQSK